MHARIVMSVLSIFLSPVIFAASLVVDTQWLKQHLNDKDLVIIDMSDETQHQRFHIAGAINLPFDALVTRVKGVSTPVPQDKLVGYLGKMGINTSSHVVVYDDMGGLNASRMVWELEQLGHENVSVLNGGLVSWILQGNPVTNRQSTPRPPTQYSTKKSGRPLAASIDDVSPKSRDKKVTILDVRTEDEYKGNPKNPRSGHIPGAKWWEWDQAVNFAEGFTNQNDDELRKSLAEIGVKDSKQPIITYCRSSHRASQTYFTLRRLGFDNVRIYTGSMLEYEQEKQQPLKIGMQP